MLESAGTSRWDGVSNNAALGHIRSMRTGDTVYIYHTGEEKAIVGIAKVMSDPYPDPKQDVKATTAKGEIKTPVIDVKAVMHIKKPLTLAVMKADPRFADFDLVRLPRLSVMPVPAIIAKIIEASSRRT